MPKKSRGAITLVVSMAILFLSTLVTFSVSRAILMEQKITNNEGRAKQAFEAAEAGLVEAMAYLSDDPDANSDGVLDTNVLDSNGDGTADSNTRAIGTASVTVNVFDVSGTMTRFRVVARGFSDDRSATRTIEQLMETLNPLPNSPQNPMTARGNVVMTGAATVRNPEGRSTIWSGSDVDLGSNNATSTRVPDLANPNYPGCMDVPMTCTLVQASSRLLAGVDVIENDASLLSLNSDDFFRNVFGTNPRTYRAAMVTMDLVPATANTEANLASNEVIWIEGNHTFNGLTVGCNVAVTGINVCPAANTKPSIVIVNGNAAFTGTPHFYGLLFVRGNITLGGSTTIHGAIIVGGNTTSVASGSLDLWYNSRVLGDTTRAGVATGSPGTWKDF